MKKVTLIFAFVAFLSYLGISQTLTWRFANYEVVNAGAQLQFDVEVMASAATTYHRDLQVYFDYNTAGFGTNWATGHVTVTPLSLMDNLYSVVNTADNTSSKIAIITEADNEMAQQGNATYFNLMPGTFTGLFKVTMDITDNTATAGIAFDEALMNGGQYYQSTSAIEPVKYVDPCIYDNDLLSNKLSVLSGTITYANSANTPINALVNGGSIGTASTDVNGYYSFSGIDDGSYTLTTTGSDSWQNETTVGDANLVLDHILGTALTGIKFLAADVTWDNNVNVNDLNLMIDVILGNASGYPASPDWLFEDQNVNVVNGVGTSSYQGLLSGDPDGSY